MKKFLILIAFLSIKAFSQGSTETTYQGGYLYMMSLDATTKQEVFKKPIGKIIAITYDSFYKSYLISYDYMGNGVSYMKLNYLKNLPDDMILMKEESYGVFSVLDTIIKTGTLIMIKTEVIESEQGNYLLMFKAENIKR